MSSDPQYQGEISQKAVVTQTRLLQATDEVAYRRKLNANIGSCAKYLAKTEIKRDRQNIDQQRGETNLSGTDGTPHRIGLHPALSLKK
jgi:hypothetical protein